MPQLTKLFEPGRIGTLVVKNRLIMGAIGTYCAGFDSEITDRIVDYYLARADGGVGLIVTAAFFIAPETATPHMFTLHDDRFIPGLRSLCDAVHAHGAKIAVQIAHPGIGVPRMWTGYEAPPYAEAVGPSPIRCIPWDADPRQLSVAEIRRIVECDGEAARRVKEAGADAVEVHAAHGYMIGAFFSPFKNRRADEYGGSLENRARLACECIASARQKVGKDFPIIFRFNAIDGLVGGTTLEDSVKMAPLFVEAGADALDITAGAREAPWWDDAIYLRPDALLAPMTEAIKKAVSVPVTVVGKIGDPVLANRILEEGKADFVSMARPLLADPELPNKAMRGELESIRRCIFCNNCRVGLLDRERLRREGRTLTCTVNPALLREREFKVLPATKVKKVMVIGGGIAGLKAAALLGQRGHHVSLYEKTAKLGGQWAIGCSEPTKADYRPSLDYLLADIGRSGVEVVLGAEVTPELVRQQRPDAVVVATGASPITPEVPGADKKNVVQAIDVFAGTCEVGHRVVVVGGKLRGMEVADLLARQGKKVTLITRSRLGGRTFVERNAFFELRQRLIEAEVSIFPYCTIFEIMDGGVYVDLDHELTFFPADSIVLAMGAKAENGLVAPLKELVPEVYVVGDSLDARTAKEAINEGAEVALVI